MNTEGSEDSPVEDPRYENPDERMEYELSLLVDPATGVPYRIKQRSLEFAKQNLNADRLDQNGQNPHRMAAAGTSLHRMMGHGKTWGLSILEGVHVLAIDVNDDNTILAGGVSGGVWKSSDRVSLGKKLPL